MKTRPRQLLILGYAERDAHPDDWVDLCAVACAEHFESCQVLVWCRRPDERLTSIQVETGTVRHIYARTFFGRWLAMVRAGRRIVRGAGGAWVVSSAGVGVLGVVGRVIASGNHPPHHIQLAADFFHRPGRADFGGGWVRRRLGLYLLRRAAGVRVVSHRTERTLVACGVDRRRIQVVPMVSDVSEFLVVGAQRQYEQTRACRFLYVGPCTAEAQVSLIVESFAPIHAQYPEATLTLYGDGPLRPQLAVLIRRLGVESAVQVRATDDPRAAVMAAHDVLCFAAAQSDRSAVLEEAAAAGLAIITTDVGCAGEYIQHGAQGQVVPRGDRARYQAAMQDYVVNPQHVIAHGQNAYAAAVRRAQANATNTESVVESFASCRVENTGILSQ